MGEERYAGLDPEPLQQIEALEIHQSGAKQQLVALFEMAVPGHLQSADAAIASGDAEALRQSAHSIKGMSASLGARELAAVALALENCAGRNELSAAPALLDAMRQEYSRTRERLQRWLSVPA
jgi:HPt (histidine-containing phosphotransfer) domain-containing protein